MICLLHQRILALLVLAVAQAPLAAADRPASLHHNPFDRPAVLAEPAAPKTAPVRVPDVPPTLHGTLVSAAAPMAILDGELLSIGQEYAGYRLVAVTEGAATLEKQGEEIRVTINDPAADAGGRRVRR